MKTKYYYPGYIIAFFLMMSQAVQSALTVTLYEGTGFYSEEVASSLFTAENTPSFASDADLRAGPGSQSILSTGRAYGDFSPPVFYRDSGGNSGAYTTAIQTITVSNGVMTTNVYYDSTIVLSSQETLVEEFNSLAWTIEESFVLGLSVEVKNLIINGTPIGGSFVAESPPSGVPYHAGLFIEGIDNPDTFTASLEIDATGLEFGGQQFWGVEVVTDARFVASQVPEPSMLALLLISLITILRRTR